MFAVIGACVVLATGFQFSNGQGQTYCEQNPKPEGLVSQEGDHCFFFVNKSSAMLKPKSDKFEFDKPAAEKECANNAAHLPKLSNESAQRKAFYELADKFVPFVPLVAFPTFCMMTGHFEKEKSILLDCGFGDVIMKDLDNLFNDGKKWIYEDPMCTSSRDPACVTFYSIDRGGFHTVNSTSYTFDTNDTVQLICHQLKSDLTTSLSTSLTTTGPPAATSPTSAPTETESNGGTANTNGFGQKMMALVVTVAVFKM